MSASQFQVFREKLSDALTANKFIKLSLGNYKGNEAELKNVYIKKVIIKKVEMLSFNYRFKTKDTFKNFSIEDGVDLIMVCLTGGFRIATLFTVNEEVIIEYNTTDELRLRIKAAVQRVTPSLKHDKEKKRLISAKDNTYLNALGLTDKDGNVFNSAQDKYKQINQYIEILSSLIRELPEGAIKNVVDMGSGKGYLTFALYDYLQQQQLDVLVTGVEYRKDLVGLCTEIAKQADFKQLKFATGTIENYEVEKIDLLIALHACDTATDDAIYKGIKAGAALIVVAPCCHKQIRREIEKHKVKNDVSFLTKYGIFLDRQAEMITDGIRAMILDYYGYKTKVFEFISDAHTPKNVLVVGVKKVESLRAKDQSDKQAEILQQIKEAKAFFGISYHHLEKLVKI